MVCAIGSCFCCLKCLQKTIIIILSASGWDQIILFIKKVPTPIITPINQQPCMHTGLMFHSHDLLTTDYTLTQCHLKGVMDLLELWVRRVWMYSCRGRDLLNSSPREGGSRKKQPTSSYIKVKLIYNQIILKIGYLHYLIKMKSFTTSF